ncbi:MAG: type II secretion system GspH family protein [Clostridium sp.]|nr:MAG: type II secretion system GspH family protein [Clostridium sp.]
MRKLAKILKNKKGFTLVEAIAVVAIMGILATVIGGLVTAGTTAYMRQKENAAAKDLGTIVQNEIKRVARSSVEVYLQDENDNLPSADNEITNEGKTYSMKNEPKKEHSVFLSKNGKLFYAKGNEEPQEYFTDPKREAEGRAFYGSFTIKVYFKAIVNSFDEVTSVKVFCDVFNAKGQIKFDSPGLEIDFIEADYSQSKDRKFVGIFSFEQDNRDAIDKDGDGWKYKNMLVEGDRNKKFAKFYFRLKENG